MPSLKMSLGLRIRSKVNRVQNSTNIDKHSLLCHLMATLYPVNSLKLSRVYLRYMLLLINNLDKNCICLCKDKGHLSATFAKPKYEMLMLHFCQHHTNPTIHNYNKTACDWFRSYA